MTNQENDKLSPMMCIAYGGSIGFSAGLTAAMLTSSIMTACIVTAISGFTVAATLSILARIAKE